MGFEPLMGILQILILPKIFYSRVYVIEQLSIEKRHSHNQYPLDHADLIEDSLGHHYSQQFHP
jgi:hypothetical protein